MSLWQQTARKVLLASASPRRRELLDRMGFTFDTVAGSVVDEASFLDEQDLAASIARLAIAKAEVPATQYPDALVLSADTVVVCGGRVLGKPDNREHAAKMLRMLSGQPHQVITGVALTCKAEQFCRSFIETTTVYFRALSDKEIGWYLDSGEAFDKAGAYGIQGRAMIFVDKIEGCFYNVVGLPVRGTIDLFKVFDAKGTL